MNYYGVKGLIYSKILIFLLLIAFVIFLIMYFYTHKISILLSSLMFLSLSFTYIFIYELYKKGNIHFNELSAEKKKYRKEFLFYNLMALLLIISVLNFTANLYVHLLSFILFIIFVLYNINRYNNKLYLR